MRRVAAADIVAGNIRFLFAYRFVQFDEIVNRADVLHLVCILQEDACIQSMSTRCISNKYKRILKFRLSYFKGSRCAVK